MPLTRGFRKGCMISSIESVHRKRMREGKDRQIIYIWEENGAIAACILPDGENIYVSIKNGYEKLFPSMIGFGERNCRALFGEREDGLVKFWVAISNRFTYMQEALADLGYSKYPEEEYANCVFPMEGVFPVELPEGFRLLYGEAYPDEENKWSALRLGFHPEYEKPGYRAGMNPYIARKSSSLYQDSSFGPGREIGCCQSPIQVHLPSGTSFQSCFFIRSYSSSLISRMVPCLNP